ncbi:MAG: TonB-dependent receptor [Bacteroidetes bacterium]|jgi:hypothetical protein|nr:TonB-dependent receptor [Bacteroidota bacterium]MBP7257105.1 TonB-dependent receptor [Chitinophagales bacterium]MBK7506271.1 TonB-dependent receptor [Bacteroidota bacterium]MBK9354594.1 TonB-dependent receptor [Bacteroidota bacterium]MBK9635521.1 TonB-dependent receptor [Bacteroidota bacterium]
MKKINILLLSCLPFLSFAQTGNGQIDNEQIDIVKDYQPVLIKSDKIGINADLPKLKQDDPTKQSYTVSEKSIEIGYKPAEIKPLKVKDEEPEPLPFVYLKAGFGNYLTPVIDFSITNKNTEKFKVGLQGDFISSKRKNYAFQDYLESGVKLFGQYNFKKVLIGTDVKFNFDKYNFYGYDHLLFPEELFDKDTMDISYRTIGFKSYFSNYADNSKDLKYKGHLGFNQLKLNDGRSENIIDFSVLASKKFKDIFTAGAQISGNSTSLKSPGVNNRFVVGFKPFAGVEMGIWRIEGGANVVIDEGDVFAFPYLKNQLEIVPTKLVMYNEWLGDVSVNNIFNTYTKNPWLSQNIMWDNYKTEDRRFIGLRGAITGGFSYDVSFGQMVYKNMPLFVNDTTDFRKFTFNYEEKLTSWNPKLSIGYQYGKMFYGRLNFEYNAYKTKSGITPYHLPSLKTNLTLGYTWNEKLGIKVDIFGESGSKVLTETRNVEKLNGIVDINLSANYNLNKYVGFFVNLNNIAFQKYQRYYLYPSYGLQALGGVVLTY